MAAKPEEPEGEPRKPCTPHTPLDKGYKEFEATNSKTNLPVPPQKKSRRGIPRKFRNDAIFKEESSKQEPSGSRKRTKAKINAEGDLKAGTSKKLQAFNNLEEKKNKRKIKSTKKKLRNKEEAQRPKKRIQPFCVGKQSDKAKGRSKKYCPKFRMRYCRADGRPFTGLINPPTDLFKCSEFIKTEAELVKMDINSVDEKTALNVLDVLSRNEDERVARAQSGLVKLLDVATLPNEEQGAAGAEEPLSEYNQWNQEFKEVLMSLDVLHTGKKPLPAQMAHLARLVDSQPSKIERNELTIEAIDGIIDDLGIDQLSFESDSSSSYDSNKEYDEKQIDRMRRSTKPIDQLALALSENICKKNAQGSKVLGEQLCTMFGGDERVKGVENPAKKQLRREMVYPCPYLECNFQVKFRKHLNFHLAKKHGCNIRIFECDFCGYISDFKGNLQLHIFRAHLKYNETI